MECQNIQLKVGDIITLQRYTIIGSGFATDEFLENHVDYIIDEIKFSSQEDELTPTMIDVHNRKITYTVICSAKYKKEAVKYFEGVSDVPMHFCIVKRKRTDVVEILKHGTMQHIAGGTAKMKFSNNKFERVNLQLIFWDSVDTTTQK